MRPGTRRGLTTVTGRPDPPPMIAPPAPAGHRPEPAGPGDTAPRPDERPGPAGPTQRADRAEGQERAERNERAGSHERAERHAPAEGPELAEGQELAARPDAAGPGRWDPKAARVSPPPPPGAAALAVALAERTADLQRLKAEYDNYRSRVHRDRLAVREAAVANVLRRFMPVLDAIGEAAGQGELTGGFQRVALALDSELAALGLGTFGAVGDPFDPRVHQAVTYRRSFLVERPVCSEILRPGYRVGDHLLRPADVRVTGPAHR
ncbi:nucleotide exchange factor GrpE [Streptomyces sp. NPDC049837]|uniref:nucleotide exchange factor GrpE n=1 Tax=Streptomyces sp. NPDC049837 TaxID=3155277 RepID=UPI00342DB7D0